MICYSTNCTTGQWERGGIPLEVAPPSFCLFSGRPNRQLHEPQFNSQCEQPSFCKTIIFLVGSCAPVCRSNHPWLT